MKARRLRAMRERTTIMTTRTVTVMATTGGPEPVCDGCVGETVTGDRSLRETVTGDENSPPPTLVTDCT
jgi:hypothetical protein